MVTSRPLNRKNEKGVKNSIFSKKVTIACHPLENHEFHELWLAY
jgi:hypothetical protein